MSIDFYMAQTFLKYMTSGKDFLSQSDQVVKVTRMFLPILKTN